MSSVSQKKSDDLYTKLTRACLRHLLRTVTAHNALFEFLLILSYSKNFALFRGFDRRIALNLLK